MYNRVLVPVDGSDPSNRAVSEALALAGHLGSAVVFLYAVDFDGIPADSYTPTLADRLHGYGAEVVADAAERAKRAGVTAETAVVEGTPHRVIVDTARDRDADLIVMGTHGRTGLEHVLLGSVTERVVRASAVPVLTVHDRRDDADLDEE
ncbi:universal stress protein [Halocalculus aciditolerans]|uniref:Universal stress protein UspA n=1 Tax=Halocalculus aciditolerans TaxID=1383812 RepID=A0A830FCV3_9EURY|nr:universal stress protein [Halocalculus aciditolerans]GGL62198.1 universal stress protein UspA [Halocalculus aciditolerans]